MRTQARIAYTVFVGAAFVLGACGGGARTQEPPMLTSAAVETSTSSARIATLERERDEARREAARAKASADAKVERAEKAQHDASARSAFETRIWERIDRFDARVQKTRAAAANDWNVRAACNALLERLDALERATHRAYGVSQADWDAYAREVESTLTGISLDIEAARELNKPAK